MGEMYNNDTAVGVAFFIASIGFFLRPLVVGKLHMTYYRKK